MNKPLYKIADEFRKSRGVKQADIAVSTGLHLNTVQRFFSGGNVSLGAFIKLIDAVGLKIVLR